MRFPVFQAVFGNPNKQAKQTPADPRRYSMDQWIADYFNFGGHQYQFTGQTTYGTAKADPIADEFSGFVNAIKSNGILSAIEMNRFSVFAEARFQWQALRSGRPGDLFGTPDLATLERPWAGGTTGDLLTRMLLEADAAGNSFWTRAEGEICNLRPDWTEIVLAPRTYSTGDVIGFKKVGFNYYHGGKQLNTSPVFFAADEVTHFAPYPDPLASYRGMSWMTPVIREIQSDNLTTEHKKKFFENAATPNLHVDYPERLKEEDFRKLIEILNENHQGAGNAYKTLYTTGGADVTVLGQNMQQMDFKAVQGAGETRLAAAAGVPAVIIGLSEGMQGSSLNAGNYTAAKRNFADKTMRPLWRNAAGSLEVLFPPPPGARLWYDDRDVAFLRDDSQDRANIQMTNATTIRQYTDAGFTPESAVSAVLAEDESLLVHTGLFSVQLQEPGTAPAPARNEVNIAEGAIRTDITLPEQRIDASTIVPTPDDLSERIAAATAVEVARGVDAAVQATAVPLVEAAIERDAAQVDRDAHTSDQLLEALTAMTEMAERSARPRRVRKHVETDDIGRITAITEEEV